jgi:hypothetical protein
VIPERIIFVSQGITAQWRGYGQDGTGNQTCDQLRHCAWEVMGRTPYSPTRAPCNFHFLLLLSIYHYVKYFQNTVFALFSHLWVWWKEYPNKSMDVMTRQLNACVWEVYLWTEKKNTITVVTWNIVLYCRDLTARDKIRGSHSTKISLWTTAMWLHLVW